MKYNVIILYLLYYCKILFFFKLAYKFDHFSISFNYKYRKQVLHNVFNDIKSHLRFVNYVDCKFNVKVL